MKIVLDTNCLLQALSNNYGYYCILAALRQGRYTLCCSNDIILEYEEVLKRFFHREIVENFLNFLLYSENVLLVTPYFKWNKITADHDDNKFVDCAFMAGADYIVTNDKHFNILKNFDFPKIEIIDIDTYKQILTK